MALRLPPRLHFPTEHLTKTNDFIVFGTESLPINEKIERSHRRAKAIALSYKPSLDDILHCSEKFWNMHLDPVNGYDGAAVALWTLQYNLSGGTLAPFVKKRPELADLSEAYLDFSVTAHFMLTELGHGLDAPNIETTATLLPNGCFDLHTPNDMAAKFMPASIPSGGTPRISIVMARMIIKGHFLGIRPFIVPLNDGKEMCKGITSRHLPPLSGAKPLGHSVTYFNHVQLPGTALLGSLKPPKNGRLQFLSDIWRIGIGSVCLTSVVISSLKLSAYTVAQYSKRRTVTTSHGQTVPLISFRTQQAPILHALVEAIVLEALYQDIRIHYTDRKASTLELRNALSTIFKTVCVDRWRQSIVALTDRCGAQGLFEHNMLSPLQSELRGVTIAEGDVLVLSIRLASELLLGRYSVPEAQYPETLLAKHEQGVFKYLRGILKELGGKHRSQDFNERILPQSVRLVEAIGSRMAYEAAKDAGVDPLILGLFEAGAVSRDMAWYTENGILTQKQAHAAESATLGALFPHLEQLLEHTGCEPYAYAAIVSDAKWEELMQSLPVFTGGAHVDLLNPTNLKQVRARL